MEAKKLYNDLCIAMNYNKNEELYPERFRTDLIINMFDYLESEIKKEAAKSAGDSKPLKYANIVLKNKDNKRRPILQKAIIKNELQVFTDSYIAFTLKNYITGLEMHNQEDTEKYPIIDRLFPITDLEIKISLSKLIDDLAILKDEDIYLLPNEFEYKIGLKVKHIKIMYNVLRFKKDDVISFGLVSNNYIGCYIRPLIIKNNDDTCLLLPFRIE